MSGKTITGTDNTDGLTGTDGDDTIIPGKGSDYIDGKGGTDTLRLPGLPKDYNWRLNPDTSIRELDYATGETDNIRNVERFEFDGGLVCKWDARIGWLVPVGSDAPAKDLSQYTARELAQALLAKL